MTALRDLLADWLAARVYVVSETSGDLAGDYRKLIDEARVWADTLNIPWDETLVPPYVLESIMAEDDEDR